MEHFLTHLNELAVSRADDIAAWFAKSYEGRRVPIYSSVDVRNAGFKLAPVDTNLFPAGFNNLDDAGVLRAVAALKAHVKRLPYEVKRILLMSENHTRNRPYFDNVAMLIRLCREVGFEIVVGRFDLEGDAHLQTETTTGDAIDAQAVHLEGTRIVTASGFDPDMIWVNNDLSSGCPQILCDAQQPVFPPPGMGWYRRRKSVHFTAYNQIIREFARYLNIDPWHCSTIIHHCGKIDFKQRKGMECVAIGVDKAIHAISKKYEEYGITREPYVYIKADSGTYGMGVMTARSGEEVFELNKKTRTKMNVIKEGVSNSEVIIQEGVPTADAKASDAAEPVVYLMGGEAVGTIWRVNEGRGDEASLNAGGMRFEAFDQGAFEEQGGLQLIGKLATLASSYEHYDSDACGHDHSNNL